MMSGGDVNDPSEPGYPVHPGEKKPIKIYVWGDPEESVDYLAATSPDEARIAWDEEISGDEPDGDPEEVRDEELDKLMFRPDDGPEITFRQRLQNLIDNGESFPVYFASSDF